MSTLAGPLCPILLTINYTILTGGLFLLLGLSYALYATYQKDKQLRAAEANVRNSTTQLAEIQAQHLKLLLEKEWLMKEVHHRVKNNLQLVISLLNMQTGYMKDEFALDAFGDIGSRIRAISLIHQRMYQEDYNMAIINMRDYITELVSYLDTGNSGTAATSTTSGTAATSTTSGAASTSNHPLNYQLDIAPIELDVSQSVPIGLILNEAITNAIKHAFPLKRDPIIVISMSQQEDSMICLTVADNGRGLPESFDLEANATMGLQLIKTLSDQLDGSLQLENRNGFILTLQFARQQGNYGYRTAQPATL